MVCEKNFRKIAEINKKFILEKISSLKSKNAYLPKMSVAYKGLKSGIFPHELKNPEFYGITDDPYEIENGSRDGFILDVFDKAGEKNANGSTIVADFSRECVVFDMSLEKICRASFAGEKDNPIPIWNQNIGYDGFCTSDWITYYDKIMEKLEKYSCAPKNDKRPNLESELREMWESIFH
jgi:hypothetical protein